jgi:hypothetical protein
MTPETTEAAPASPLPEEVARLVIRLRDQRFCGQEPMRAEAAATLERQAREIDELQRKYKFVGQCYDVEIEDGVTIAGWLRKVKTEREDACARIAELEAERDAIRAKTIVECAKVADGKEKSGPSVLYGTAEAIRRLNQPLPQPPASEDECVLSF